MPGLTKDQIATANKIHKDLFKNFVWTSDEDANGVFEYWGRMELFMGKYRDDCDSFAIEMDFRLKAAGIPQESRRLGACSIEGKGLDHCVLILEGEDGLYVSECNTSTVVKLKALPYTKWYWSDPSGDITKDWLKVPDSD